jgi:hypothetical protein
MTVTIISQPSRWPWGGPNIEEVTGVSSGTRMLLLTARHAEVINGKRKKIRKFEQKFTSIVGGRQMLEVAKKNGRREGERPANVE